MKGKLKRYLSGDGAVVCVVLEGTEMCREMERIHQTSAVCTAALGQPVLEVLDKHGFTNYKLFSRMFKEVYGDTPREIRRRAREQE